MKERISLTIDNSVLKNVDSLIDNINIRSRSQAIEILLSDSLNREKSVVILCGGKDFVLKGTEVLRPLSKIKEKTIIERIISKCKKHGFNKFYILGPKKHLDEIYKVAHNIDNVELRYIEETGAGSAKALLSLRREIHSTFLVIPGDIIFDFDLTDMFTFHKSGSKCVTLAIDILKRPKRAHYKLGKVTMKGNSIINYVDESKDDEVQVISTFIFFAEPSLFDVIGRKVISLQKDLFPILAEKNLLRGYPFSGYWFNIHSKEDISDAERVSL